MVLLTSEWSSEKMSDCALQTNKYVSNYIYCNAVWIIPQFGDVTFQKRDADIDYSINEIKKKTINPAVL